MNIRTIIGTLGVVSMLSIPGAAWADSVSLYGDSVKASPQQNMKKMTLSISGPDGFYAKEHASFGDPRVSLRKNGAMADGLYTWELTGATNELVPANPMGLNNGRGDTARQFINKSVTESGFFRVQNGVIMSPDALVEEPQIKRKKLINEVMGH